MGQESVIQVPLRDKNLLKKMLNFPFALVGKPTEAVGKSGGRIYPMQSVTLA